VDGILYFPLTIRKDSSTGIQTFSTDVPYSNIKIYLNSYKLIYKLDYVIKFPYVCITTKRYIDYTLSNQNIHIRIYGLTLDINKINKLETTGFVNHGVLLRNNKYDLTDDRVLSIYIDVKLYNRSNILFAENDNTVRLSHSLNGLPYTIKKPFIPVKTLTGLDTISIRYASIAAE
jgi:hypothetical protein